MGKRIARIKELNRLANEGIKEKVHSVRKDKRHLALIVVELFLVMMLVISIFFAFDPDVNFPGSEKVSWPVKLLLFFCGVALVLKLYSYTKDFRVENKNRGQRHERV